MKRFPFVLAIIFAAVLTLQAGDFARYVDPFIGTGGHGHTFPGATVPFGFVQLSPDTRVDNWDGSGGYHYSDDVIYGFSHTHLSGTGIPDYCDILFAPYVSDKSFFEANPEDTRNGYASKFSHENESAQPGYYAVHLEDENITAEMTATKRVGLHRYTFSENSIDKRITLDLKWRDEVLDSSLRIVGNKRIEGFRRSSSWAKDQIVFFAAEFSAPFDSVEFQNKKNGKTVSDKNDPASREKAAFLFKSLSGNSLLVKVAISPVSIEGARKNLETEITDWDFDRVKDEAREDWNKELSKIEVSGGTDAQMTTFYTALYHTMIAPNIFQDVDGKYLGLDKKVHSVFGPESVVQSPKSAGQSQGSNVQSPKPKAQ
ncbi:MAG: GH92 family glycosyl hydrolase, partial [Acidobacteria bacterium]|nr:GH92 family glycosyl hydrolase [Acidobacteriota bacterium]